MKKLLGIAVLGLALAGCQEPVQYDEQASVQQLKDECKRFGGELNTYRNGYSNVNGMPFTGNCINVTTGNKYEVYARGVLK